MPLSGTRKNVCASEPAFAPKSRPRVLFPMAASAPSQLPNPPGMRADQHRERRNLWSAPTIAELIFGFAHKNGASWFCFGRAQGGSEMPLPAVDVASARH